MTLQNVRNIPKGYSRNTLKLEEEAEQVKAAIDKLLYNYVRTAKVEELEKFIGKNFKYEEIEHIENKNQPGYAVDIAIHLLKELLKRRNS